MLPWSHWCYFGLIGVTLVSLVLPWLHWCYLGLIGGTLRRNLISIEINCPCKRSITLLFYKRFSGFEIAKELFTSSEN